MVETTKKMNIVHINTTDTFGGAARTASRLHCAMLENGLESKLIVRNSFIMNTPACEVYSKLESKITGPIRSLLLSKKTGPYKKEFGLFSLASWGANIDKNRSVRQADCVYLHWVNDGFLGVKALERLLKTGKKVIWYMHDMWAVTGGCHHSFECDHYMDRCTECIFFKNRYGQKIVMRQFQKKQLIFAAYKNLVFVTPSRWLYECVKKSTLAKGHNVHHIPNMVDRKKYRPLDKKVVRDILGLHADKRYILFGADQAITNPYKGWKYLKEALDIIGKSDDIELLAFGAVYNKQIANAISVPVRFFGTMMDDYSIVLLYNAADLFVLPSLADNFPNTMLESISCGTPVVGFNVGGIPEMVNKNTGYLAEYKNANDLAKGIMCILQSKLRGVSSYAEPYGYTTIVKAHMDIILRDNDLIAGPTF